MSWLSRVFMSGAGVSLLFASGCQWMRPELEQEMAVEMVGAYSASDSNLVSNVVVGGEWWQEFGSAELTALVEEALRQNLGLDQAWARLRQAEALADIAGAGRYPELRGVASGKREWRSPKGEESGTQSKDSFKLGLAASYEVDLWGKVSGKSHAAGEQALASREQLEVAATSVAATVTDLWLELVALKQELLLVEEQLKVNKTTHKLLLLRMRKGVSPLVDVLQQEQVVAGTMALMPVLESSIKLHEHQIAVLLGKAPQANLSMATDVLPEVPELPAVGLPAELLEQRPDIRASWRQVDAAGWGVAVAKADRLPAIRLTADGGYGAEELSDLFDNWAANLFAGLTAPLLDGGRRRAEVRRTQAVWEERVGRYREVVVNALREVEDGLVRSQGVEERIEILRGELRVAGETKVEAVRRYKKGVTDYLPVLQSLLSEQKLERNMLGVERDLRKERVALYRALGGDWTGSWREEIEDGENNE